MKQQSKKLAIVATLAGITFCTLGAVTSVNAGDETSRAETNYERKSGEQQARPKPWANASTKEPTASISKPTENSGAGVNAADGQSLDTSWERFLADGFADVDTRVDEHTDRITDLEALVGTLENDPRWWEGLPPRESDWGSTGSSQPSSSWTPDIATQTRDFVQTRDREETYSRTVEVYEENMVTGEQRLADTYEEHETRTTTEQRTVDVANNPNGGTDGWSNWADTSGPYNCSGWSPSPSTVNEGRSFTQSRDCSRDQRRDIYYLVEGSVEAQRSESQVVRSTYYRTATGTKPVEECRYTASTNMYRVTNNTWFGVMYDFLEWDNREITTDVRPANSENPSYTRSRPYTGASGYNYYIGPYSHSRGPDHYYQICRIRK